LNAEILEWVRLDKDICKFAVQLRDVETFIKVELFNTENLAASDKDRLAEDASLCREPPSLGRRTIRSWREALAQ